MRDGFSSTESLLGESTSDLDAAEIVYERLAELTRRQRPLASNQS
jgi:hypothetical protein